MIATKFKRIMLTVLTITLTSSLIAQGPWTQKKKTGFVQFQTTQPTGTYDGLIVKENSITDRKSINREVLNMDFGIYAQYGITDKLTLITNIPFKYVATQSKTDSLYHPNLLSKGSLFGLSNFHLGIKYRLIEKKIKVATSFQANLNTSRSDLDKGLTTGYLSNSFGLFGHVGGSISKRVYSFLDLGYNVSTNNYSDFIKVFFELGYKASKSKEFWVILNIDSKESMENGSYLNENLGQTGLYVNDQEWGSYRLKLMYETEKQIGYSFSFPALFSANEVGYTPTMSLGVHKKW